MKHNNNTNVDPFNAFQVLFSEQSVEEKLGDLKPGPPVEKTGIMARRASIVMRVVMCDGLIHRYLGYIAADYRMHIMETGACRPSSPRDQVDNYYPGQLDDNRVRYMHGGCSWTRPRFVLRSGKGGKKRVFINPLVGQVMSAYPPIVAVQGRPCIAFITCRYDPEQDAVKFNYPDADGEYKDFSCYPDQVCSKESVPPAMWEAMGELAATRLEIRHHKIEEARASRELLETSIPKSNTGIRYRRHQSVRLHDMVADRGMSAGIAVAQEAPFNAAVQAARQALQPPPMPMDVSQAPEQPAAEEEEIFSNVEAWDEEEQYTDPMIAECAVPLPGQGVAKPSASYGW